MKKNKIFIKNLAVLFFTISTQQIISSELIGNPQIIQPGAPGNPSKIINAQEATDIANTSYIKADVDFLQGMIVHHEQAIIMSEMADERTNNKTILDLAKRIDASQKDEINFMESWLKDRDEFIDIQPDNHHSHQGHSMHNHIDMVGMATPKQLKDLSNSDSTNFDRLFLKLMINHHDGALEMVEELKKYPGNTYDPILNEFVSDLINDQGVEIERMNTLLTGLSDDPRAGLAGGLFIAEEAILNMELITSLKKPTGFFDPENPAAKGSEDLTEDNEDKTTAEISRSLRSHQCYLLQIQTWHLKIMFLLQVVIMDLTFIH